MEDGEGEKVWKIKVAAVPEKGKANAELCRYIAKLFEVSKSSVVVSQGEASQRKVVKILKKGLCWGFGQGYARACFLRKTWNNSLTFGSFMIEVGPMRFVPWTGGRWVSRFVLWGCENSRKDW
ncbi:MAG: DUF167 domain-containing protein [Candidatus Altimarinota bacterium]